MFIKFNPLLLNLLVQNAKLSILSKLATGATESVNCVNFGVTLLGYQDISTSYLRCPYTSNIGLTLEICKLIFEIFMKRIDKNTIIYVFYDTSFKLLFSYNF